METANNYKGSIATELLQISSIAREIVTDSNWLNEVETTQQAEEIKNLCEEFLEKVYETQDKLSKLL